VDGIHLADLPTTKSGDGVSPAAAALSQLRVEIRK
jgi:hypothetical protein